MVSGGRVELSDGANVVGGVAGDADVPVALEDDLDVLDVENVGAAQLGHLAGGGGDVVDELVDELEDGLCVLAVLCVREQGGGNDWEEGG